METGAGRVSPHTTTTSPTPIPPEGVGKLSRACNHNVPTPVRVLGVSDFLVVSGPPDRRMATVAAAQRGRISQAQLTVVGMSRQKIRTRVKRGTLHPVHRAVFAVGHPGRVELGDETAALLACGPGAGLCHRSACLVWRFIRDEPGEVDLLLPGAVARSRPGILVHRSRTITPADIVVHRGLPVVRPALALLQFADVAEPRAVELAVDEALARQAVSRTKLREVVAVHGAGRRGGSLLGELAAVRPSSVTRSGGEERLREMILASGLPTPEMQARLLGFEGDFYWAEAAYVVEYDGFHVHSTRSAWQRDRVKDRVFAANGIRLDRFTWEDVTEQPLATIAHISGQIATRTVLRGGLGSPIGG